MKKQTNRNASRRIIKKIIRYIKRSIIVQSLIKMLRGLKKFAREICTGVVIGLIILGLTPVVNNYREHRTQKEELTKNLSLISIGMSKGYIDSLFGAPMVEYEPSTLMWEQYSDEERKYTSACYKLVDCILLCLYGDNSIIAFAVIVNSEDIYKIPYNMYMNNRYLLDFIYSDFSEDVQVISGNVPANNTDFAYYFEEYYGGGPADYHSFIIGSYKDFHINSSSNRLMFIGQDYAWKPNYFQELSASELEIFRELRTQVRPNVFGMIHGDYEEEIDFASYIIGSRTNASLLFDDWDTE